MRWIKELFQPALKCERIGHSVSDEERSGYAWPGKEYRSVADEISQTRIVCYRCGIVLDDWKEISREGIQSLSMPSDQWRLLKRDGYLWS